MHNVTHLGEASVTEAQYFIKNMMTLGLRAEPKQSAGHNRMSQWDTSPDSANKCRVLNAHPAG